MTVFLNFPLDPFFIFCFYISEENEKELLSIDNKCKDAEKNAGDMEVLDAMFAKARYLSKIGSWEAAYVAYDLILAKDKTSTGKKIDANMEKAKIALITQVERSISSISLFLLVVVVNPYY